MKFSTIAALAFCGVLAISATGCKYDDADEAGAKGKDINAVSQDIGAVQGEDGVPATGLKFDQDPNYVRCTDVDFTPVYFGFDASTLPEGELPKIEAVAQHLQQNPGRVVLVEGNCDERGSNEYNLSLGELRAIYVRDYLTKCGISAERVQTKSYGEEKPAVMGSDEAAYAKNRRGEFAIFKHK